MFINRWMDKDVVCIYIIYMGFPGSSGGKESARYVRKIPWRREWQPTPIFFPGKSHGQRSLVGYSPWGRKELDTTDWLKFSLSYICMCVCVCVCVCVYILWVVFHCVLNTTQPQKQSEVLPFATTCKNLEGIMLSEINWKKKDKYCMISLICGI